MATIFDYNDILNERIKKTVLSSFPSAPAESLLEEVISLLGNFRPSREASQKSVRAKCDINFATKIEHTTISDELYYAIMLARNVYPQFFPSHEICFIASNIVGNMLLFSNTKKLVLLCWELLPIAILMAKFVEEIHLPVNDDRYQKEHVFSIQYFLKNILPSVDWKVQDEKSLLTDAFILGNPQSHYGNAPLALYEIESISSGLLLTNWTFLNGKKNTYPRSKWLESRLIQSVWQLAKPKRQSMLMYPAFILLQKQDKAEYNIQFIDLSKKIMKGRKYIGEQQQESVDGKDILSFLYTTLYTTGTGDVDHSSNAQNFTPLEKECYKSSYQEIPFKNVIESDGYNLSPLFYFTHFNTQSQLAKEAEILSIAEDNEANKFDLDNPFNDFPLSAHIENDRNIDMSNNMCPVALTKENSFERNIFEKSADVNSSPLLRSVANVLRCQIKRTRPTEQEIEGYFASKNSLQKNHKNSHMQGLFKPEKGELCHEINFKDFDPITGFLNVTEPNYVQMSFTGGAAHKYIIQEKDILLFYRGSGNNLGKVGLIDSLDSLLLDIDEQTGEKKPIKAVSGTAFCVIRLFNSSPFWVYHYLQKPAVVQYLLSKATGSGLLVISTEDLKDTPFAYPSQEDIATFDEGYRKIRENMQKIRDLQKRIHQDVQVLKGY